MYRPGEFNMDRNNNTIERADNQKRIVPNIVRKVTEPDTHSVDMDGNFMLQYIVMMTSLI